MFSTVKFKPYKRVASEQQQTKSEGEGEKNNPDFVRSAFGPRQFYPRLGELANILQQTEVY